MERIDYDLGARLIPYHEGWTFQKQIHAEVAHRNRPSTLILLEHEAVYTVGRRAHSWERPEGAFVEPGHVPVVDVDRGGKTTWHGPGQLTAYPIIRLASPIDVIRYVRALEAAVMELCSHHGLSTMRVQDRSGVWLPADSTRPERKICALGVRIARGVSMHGIGLNVSNDLRAFDLDRIVPCGIDDAGVTSLHAETGERLHPADLGDELTQVLRTHLAPLSEA